MPTITIDSRTIDVPEGLSVLQAARLADISIPTLCYLEKLPAIGACRVCVVEVEGTRALMASCALPVSDGMNIRTNTKRVRDARRMVVDLLLSEHSGNCQVCDRAENCELNTLAKNLGIREIKFEGKKAPPHLDTSSPSLRRDAGKCIKCRRCVSVCKQIQGVGALVPQYRGFKTIVGPAFGTSLDNVSCVYCGQCAAVCPVGAIGETDVVEKVWEALDNPTKTVIVQTAPAVRAALGECFGYPPGTLVTGKMISALRHLGFDGIFDTNFAADLTILEEGHELLHRLKSALVDKKETALPMFTSCSPGWIRFAETFYPEFLPHLSTCKSPQQMFGAIAKTYYAAKIGVKPEDMVVVSVMPCTAKKSEAQRPEMNASGVTDVDYVMTTRELGRMIRQAGLEFDRLPEGTMDSPIGASSGAADIFANTGGVMEAALRTVYEVVTGKALPFANLHVTPVAGLKGIKEASITIENTTPEWKFLEGVVLKIAVAHGLANARHVLDSIKSGQSQYHFVEVMTCPGGCIGGGGQPRFTTDAVREARIKAIYREDEGKPIRKSHENPHITALYNEFLKYPFSEKSHELLHTHYIIRKKN